MAACSAWAGISIALAPAPTPVAALTVGADNSSHLYSLDGFGGLHPAGTSPQLSNGTYFGWDIGRALAMFPDGLGGYVLDGFGGVHPIGNAPAFEHAAYFGWDIARGIALAPWSTSANPAGWTLDGWGGVHPFGGAPEIGLPGYWAGWDIARGLVVTPDSTPGSVHGYVLDGFGGLHPFGLPAPGSSAYFGFDIARAIGLVPGSGAQAPGGYVLEGYGGVHPFGGAPAVQTSGFWSGWDVARAMTMWTGAPAGAPGGWVLSGTGRLYAFGSAPAVDSHAVYGFDIARGAAGSGGSSGGRRPPQAAPLFGQSAMQDLINQDRAAAGLAPLGWSPCLASIAAQHSADMAATHTLYHANGVSLDFGCGLGSSSTAENCGFMPGSADDGAANQMFMQSPPHRANTLGDHRYVGTAWARAQDGSYYITIEFA